MKKLITAIALCFLIFLLPIIAISIFRKDAPIKDTPEPEKIQSNVYFTEPDLLSDNQIIQVLVGEEVVNMKLSEYVLNVVAAEMPAAYPKEALKAQAIAARTNAIYKKKIREEHPDRASHENADICANYSHCQAFADENAQKEKWGSDYEKYRTLVAEAVRETDGQIITYKGNPISALFHSTSSGKTENAADVWGSEIPYLLSVDSAWDQSDTKFQTEVRLSAEEFKKTLTEKYEKAVLEGKPATWFDKVERSEAGGIVKIEIGGVELAGRIFRNLYGLRSANITFAVNGDQITMTVKGYGHGVGMSQCGAGAMAKEGSTAEEIIRHYYTGVEIEKLETAW